MLRACNLIWFGDLILLVSPFPLMMCSAFPCLPPSAPLAGEDLEMIKYPPQDDFVPPGVPPYSRPVS